MFTIPVSSGSGLLLVARPSASSGTITNATNAYDLPSGLDDDPPYTTSADRATVTGSATPGAVDYATVEYNTFPSRSRANFALCSLVIGVSASLDAVATSSAAISGGDGGYQNYYVTSSLIIEYQVNGSTWVQAKQFNCVVGNKTVGFTDLGTASNVASARGDEETAGTVRTTAYIKEKVAVQIPAGSFSTNLNNLKVRFRLATCTNSTTTSYQSAGSYNIWDIRANIS